MQKIDRRKALTVVAAAPAAAALATVPALGSVEDDAKLLRLWEEWKAQLDTCRVVNDAYDETQSKVTHEAGPYWELTTVKDSPWRAVFNSSWHDDVSQRIVPLKATDAKQARDRAVTAQASLVAERRDCEQAARRKHKLASAKRAHDKAYRRLSEIADEIANTEAEGFAGIAVKLALRRYWNYDEDGANDHDLLVSVYETTVKLTGGRRSRGVSRALVI